MPIALFNYIIQNSNGSSFTRVPVDAAKAFIESFILLPSEKITGECLAFNDGIPTIAFLTGENDFVEVTGEGGLYRIQSAWLSCRVLENVKIKASCSKDPVLIIRFNPIAFHRIFNLNAKALRYQYVWELDQLGEDVKALCQIVLTTKCIEDKIRKIEHFMLELDGNTWPRNYVFEEAVSYIMREKGKVSIQTMLSSLKVNYKWLERSFSNYIGISPKEFARLQRFINAYSDLVTRKGEDLLMIAIDNGYYDQTHFTKEFKRIAGKSPMEYLKSGN